MTGLLDRASGRHSQAEQRRVELDDVRARIHKCKPAIIQSYNTDTKRASVQILPRLKHFSGDIDVPELLELPVQQPFAGQLFLGFEPKEGDECLVLFSDRESESSKENGQVHNLKYSRMHDISDGFVIPFCFSETASQNVTSGVSLAQCFLDLANIVRDIATNSTPPLPAELQATQLLITKLENVL